MLLAVPPMVCVWLGVAEAGYLRYYMLLFPGHDIAKACLGLCIWLEGKRCLNSAVK